MKLRKLVLAGLFFGMLGLNVNVWASDSEASELECYVGDTIDLGNVNQIFNNNDVVTLLSDGDVNIVNSGECLVVLDDGRMVHIVALDGEEEVQSEEIQSEKQTSSETETDSILKDDEKVLETYDLEDETEQILGLDDIDDDAQIVDGVTLSSDIEVQAEKKDLEDSGKSLVKTSSKIRESEHTGKVGDHFILPVLEGTASQYLSMDEEVAKVSKDGVVLLLKEGRTKILVSANDKVYTCNLTVLNPEFDNSDLILNWDENYTFDIGGNFLGEKVTYSVVKGEDIASVSDTGEVTFSDSGEAIIRASVAGMEFNKKIVSNSRRKQIWDDMQGAIQQCLGTPYVYGGFTPGVGLDCSGYVSYVYNTVGLMSGRTTAQGLYNMFGLTDDPKPGDVVYFAGTYACSDYITHVGLYAGDGMMYHSGEPNTKVAIAGYYADHLVGYGSILND